MAQLTTKAVNTKIETHEEICALRYEAIHDRLCKMEALMVRAMWTTFGIMAAALSTVIVKGIL